MRLAHFYDFSLHVSSACCLLYFALFSFLTIYMLQNDAQLHTVLAAFVICNVACEKLIRNVINTFPCFFCNLYMCIYALTSYCCNMPVNCIGICLWKIFTILILFLFAFLQWVNSFIYVIEFQPAE